MPVFSKRSIDALETCDHHLQVLFNEVVKHRDCTVVCGHRGQADQEVAFTTRASTKRWPGSKHNSQPSMAVDVVPYIEGRASFDPRECLHFAGFVIGLATAMNLGHRIRWGGDWNRNYSVGDERFVDMPHFELI